MWIYILTASTAILSIILALLKIHDFYKNRAILKLSYIYPALLISQYERTEWFTLHATNVGQRPCCIQGFYLKEINGNQGLVTNDNDPSFALPKTLNETDSLNLRAIIDEVKLRDLSEVGVWDSFGKYWKLSKKQIKQINKKSSELKKSKNDQ